MKNFAFTRSFLYLSLLLGISASYALVIEQNPLAGLQSETPDELKSDVQYPPNLYLALSVEFPTAGVAYSDTKSLNSVEQLTKKYLGYFDHTKCYVYNDNEGAFIPSSAAQEITIGGKTFLGCNNGSSNEFSGNVLNYMTMSAIDIFRYVMTGGNRAKGVGSDADAYNNAENGYNNKGVYLRSSRKTNRLTGAGGYGYLPRAIDFTDSNMKQAVRYIIPHRYIPDVVGDGQFNNFYTINSSIYRRYDGVSANHTNDGNRATHGKEIYGQMGVKATNYSNGTLKNLPTYARNLDVRPNVPVSGPKKNDIVRFVFNEFGLLIGRNLKVDYPSYRDKLHIKYNVNYNNPNCMTEKAGDANKAYCPPPKDEIANTWAPADVSDTNCLVDGQTRTCLSSTNTPYIYDMEDFDILATPDTHEAAGADWRGFMPVVVNACNSTGNNDNGGRDSDTTKCSTNGKTLGLVHKYFGQFNLAAFGYLNEDNMELNGGVLRAALSNLENEFSDVQKNSSGAYILDSVKNSKFKVNPDPAAATASNVDNSGVINYLNKFGDYQSFKAHDPASELYYDVTRYIRGLPEHSLTAYEKLSGTAEGANADHQNTLSGADAATKKKIYDNFPAIKFTGGYNATNPTLGDPLVLSSGMTKKTYDDMRAAVADRLAGTKTDDGQDPAVAAYNALSKEQQQAYRNAACRTNAVLLIGDTNTHSDYNLPNFLTSKKAVERAEYPSEDTNTSGANGVNAINAGMNVLEYTNAVLKADLGFEITANLDMRKLNHELLAGKWCNWNTAKSDDDSFFKYDKACQKDNVNNWSFGSSHTAPGMAGVAYWMRANDNRKDLLGEQRATNVIIDVLEGGSPRIVKENKDDPVKFMRNPYYLAAKWGGFGLSLNSALQPKEGVETNIGLDAKPDSRAGGFTYAANNPGSWTMDTTGKSYISTTAYTICKDEEGNVIPNEDNQTKGYVKNEYDTDTSTTGGVDRRCPFISATEKQAYETDYQQFQAQAAEVPKRFGVNANQMPYNLSPGNDPETLESSLKAMFAISDNQARQQASASQQASYSQAPSATAYTGGIALCAENKNCDVQGVGNQLVSGIYDLKTNSGNVVVTDVFLRDGQTISIPNFSGDLANNIKNNIRTRTIYTYSDKQKAQIEFNAKVGDVDNYKAILDENGLTEEDLSKYAVNYVSGRLAAKQTTSVTVTGGNYPEYVGTIVNSNLLEILPVGQGEKSRFSVLSQVASGGYTNEIKGVSCKADSSSASGLRTNNKYFGVASNDGIYHILSVNDHNVSEVYGYIPSTALKDKLNTFASKSQHIYINDGTSYHLEFCDISGKITTSNDGRTSSIAVDSETKIAEGEFTSLVVGTTGRGGRAIYAIDVTKDTPELKWEITDKTAGFEGLGLTISSIETAQLADGRTVLVISSGYNNDNGSYIYIVDAATAKLIKKISLGSNTASVGSPFVYDHDDDGILDAIYVGDTDGKLYKITYAKYIARDADGRISSVNWDWFKSQDGLEAEVIFDPDKDKMLDGSAMTAKPITIAPYAARQGEDVYVIFATGQNLNRIKSEGGLTTDAQNFAYGIYEPNFSTEVLTTAAPTTMLPSNMGKSFQNTFAMPQVTDTGVTQIKPAEGNNPGSNTSYYSSSSTTVFSKENRGWRVTLAQGYTATLSEILQKRLAVFMVTKPNKDKCDDEPNKDKQQIETADELCAITAEGQTCLSGTTALIALDIATGAQYKGRAIFDTSGDNKITSKSSCVSFAKGSQEREDCEKNGDEEASVIFINDFLSTGGGSLTKFYTEDPAGGPGGGGRLNGGVLSGFGGSGNNLIPITPFGISSFIRNSLREIRR